MIKQYPNTLKIHVLAADNAVQNDEGVFVPQILPEPISLACRFEPSKERKEVPTTDGKNIISKGVVYMPASSPFIDRGTTVEVPGSLEPTIVLDYYNGELHHTITV